MAAAHGTEHRSAIERALDLSGLGVAHLRAIETALLPAYRSAVAAMDTAAVKALALQIVGGVARIVDAQAQVVRLVPQADTSRHAAMTSTAETDPFTPDAADLATLTAAKAASEGMGLASGVVGRGVTAVASGATAGGFGNVAGHFIGDVYDQVLDGKEGFDSVSSYGKSFGEGAALGGATAAVGLVASKYLPQGTRSLAQEAAASRPHVTRVLEATRSVGVGVGVKLQTTVRDFLDTLGGPPGFRFAYAGNPAIPPRLASAPPTAPVWIVVRPLKDLNAPMKMEGGDRGGPLGEIESVEPGEEIAAMFDEFSSPERYRDAKVSRRPRVDGDEDVSEFDDGYQINRIEFRTLIVRHGRSQRTVLARISTGQTSRNSPLSSMARKYQEALRGAHDPTTTARRCDCLST